jgi:cytochrome c oxidase assembly protein subunit 15
MLLVLIMGAAVTNTGSAEGCGRSWPLCTGQFVPEFTVSTAIEYSHRAVTGVEGILVISLTLALFAISQRDREVVVLATLMLATLLLQAGLGAGAVLWPQSPIMLATHFGVSLVAVASTFLSAAVVFERTRPAPPRRPAIPRDFRNLAVVVTLYILAVVYLGAYVRHAGVSLACVDWPLCNGQVFPPLDGATAVVFAHRVAALGAVLLLGGLAYKARTIAVGGAAATVAFTFAFLQSLSGALVVWTHLGLFSTLLHAALVGVLFAALAYVVRLALRPATRDVQQPWLVSRRHALEIPPSPAHAASGGRSLLADDAGGKRTVTGSAERATRGK